MGQIVECALVWFTILVIRGSAVRVAPFSFPEGIQLGSAAGVLCTTIGGKNLHFNWLKDGTAIENGWKGTSITQTSKISSTLVIDAIEDVHIGNYTCSVSIAGTDERDSYSSFLSFPVPPKWISEPLDRVRLDPRRADLNQGILCDAFGWPKPRIYWTDSKNSLLNEGTWLFPRRVSQLRRDSTPKFDAVCIADNGVGEPLKKVIRIFMSG